MQSTVTWKDGMAFDAEVDGFEFGIDASAEHGGRGYGPKPKGLTLASLAGCTAMDVISILRKMRQNVRSFEVSAASTLADEHPKKFETIEVTYRLTGEDLQVARVKRAVELSEERYCGVRATLAPTVALSTRIFVNDEEI